MFLDQQKASSVIDYAISKGADFAELFIERTVFNYFRMIKGKLETSEAGIDFGVGVRLFYGHQVLYSYTNDLNVETLKALVANLAASRSNPNAKFGGFNQSNVTDSKHFFQSPSVFSNDGFDDEKLVSELNKIHQNMMSQGDKIIQTDLSTIERQQQIEIFNSEGLHIVDTRPYTRMTMNAMAEDGKERGTSSEGPGIFGFRDALFASRDLMGISQTVAKDALTMLTAKAPPAGKFPVVLGNGFGGVIFHEACGHLLETTSVAKKASVFHDKMGEMIASPVVNALDDGTREGDWGSIGLDDEGMKTQNTQLIKDGKLVSFLVDKMGALKTGYARTGSGRRQNYRFAPTSRMRNTYIAAGEHSLESMIASIENGIYCKKLGGGSVSPGTGEFNFAATQSYEIKNGKLGAPLKGATLIGTGPEILKEISMVGRDLQTAAGMCGSVSGSVPVTVGQPSLKVDSILVGGRA